MAEPHRPPTGQTQRLDGIIGRVTRPTYDESMQWFAAAVPELAPLLAKHLHEEGELLPYVLFEDDYMAWVKTTALADPEAPSLQKFLGCIEALLAGPADEASNLVWIGFVEHLIAGGEHRVIAQFEGRLGPATKTALEEFQSQQRELSELRRRFAVCCCRELRHVSGSATSFHQEHLVWVDEVRTGLDVFRCPQTQCWWSSSDRRAGARLRCIVTRMMRQPPRRFG